MNNIAKTEEKIAHPQGLNEEYETFKIAYEYRKSHPSCKYCKYRFFPTEWSIIPRCEFSEKAVDDFVKIRAVFCKYYEPKEEI